MAQKASAASSNISQHVDAVIDISTRFRDRPPPFKLKELKAAGVSHVYNPLEYAWDSHVHYLKKFAAYRAPVLWIGMNPGPWGMAQTGVPFGEVAAVRDWMGIESVVQKPSKEHPKRPIQGFECTRSEVSGRRLWGWAQTQFGEAQNFFKRFFVCNYCPWVFMKETGANVTPDKLPAAIHQRIIEVCDLALAELSAAFEPEWVVGIGIYAEKRIQQAITQQKNQHPKPQIGRILHPSPASPAANRGWAEQANRQLRDLGLLPEPEPEPVA